MIRRLPALGMLLMTVLFWSLYQPFEPVGPGLLHDPGIAEAFRTRGLVAEEGGRFILTVSPGDGVAGVAFRFPELSNCPFIRVRARMATQDVVVGQPSWKCARLALVQFTDAGKRLPYHHEVVSVFGSSHWKHYEDVFQILPKAAYVEVVLQQLGVEGTAQYEQIEVQPAKPRASFIWWRLLFVGIWVVAAVLYFPLCRLHQRRLKVLILLNALAILCGVLMPSGWIGGMSQQARQAVKELRARRVERSAPAVQAGAEKPPVAPAKKPPKKPEPQFDPLVKFEELVSETKIGHLLLFASLCFLVYLSAALERQHRVYFLKVGGDILLFAGITESLQFLTLDRTARLEDLLIDLYGIAAALLFFVLVLPLIRRIGRS